MLRSNLFSRLAAAGAVIALAACGSDSPTGPSSTQLATMNADVAVSTGQTVASDVYSFSGSELAVAADLAAPGAPSAGTCTRSGDTVTCTGAREGTLTVTRSFKIYDAAGAIMSAFDRALTDHVVFSLDASGTLTGTNATVTSLRHRSLTLSGLLGDESTRQWDGVGTSTVTSSYTGDNGTRRYESGETDSTRAVVIGIKPTRSAWPLSGSIVRNVTATQTLEGDRTVSRTMTRRVVVTFNGTANVPLTVATTGPRGSTQLSCTLHLDTRTVGCGTGL